MRTLQRIEKGKRASLESLKCLAAVFETSVSKRVQEQTMTNTQTTNQHFIDQAEKEAITKPKYFSGSVRLKFIIGK